MSECNCSCDVNFKELDFEKFENLEDLEAQIREAME